MSPLFEHSDTSRYFKRSDAHESVLQSVALKRIAAHGDEELLLGIVLRVGQEKTLLESGSITPASLRERQQALENLETDVATTVRMMKQLAKAGWLPNNLKPADILKIVPILQNYYLGYNRPTSQKIGVLIGQKFDPRAFFIRYIDSIVPPDTEKRFASIAELVRIGGYPDTSDQHVRSTLMRGIT